MPTRIWDGACPVPLPTLLSQALVAHTIELDNEAEHQLPHRTTRQQDPDTERDGPWLVSFALYANVLQYVDADDVTVAALRARARTKQLLLGGLLRWGYIILTPPAGQPLRKPPQDDATVRARQAGLRAREVWSPLSALVDDRWRRRLGAPVIDRLDRALRAVFDALSIEPPAYLPVIHPTQGGKVDAAPAARRHDGRTHRGSQRAARCRRSSAGSCTPSRSTSRRSARISLAISANTLRVLDASGTRLGDLPRSDRRVPGGQRHVRRMAGTPRLRRDRAGHHGAPGQGRPADAERREGTAEVPPGPARHGGVLADQVRRGRHGRPPGCARGHRGRRDVRASPLAPGLVPYPDNWRARVRRPEILPHHPMVLHRGGYPDGS